MKNLLKYSFSIMLIISCLIMFSMLSFKVLFTDDAEEAPTETEMTEEQENNEDTEGKDNSSGADKSETAENGGKTENENTTTTTTQGQSGGEYIEVGSFTTADASYFEDALFIGDSRTMGLAEYGGIAGADFFCDTGMNVYNVYDKTKNISGVGNVSLDSLLKSKKYGKIYLMLGINELGYSMDSIVSNYKALVDWIRERAPESILFLEANLHVTASRSDSDKYFNNSRMNKLNKNISSFADGKNIFYIDINSVFDDEKGNLRAEYTSDSTHPLAKYYTQWKEWLLTRAVVR